MPPHVTSAELHRNGDKYVGRRMRIACLDDYASSHNPDGIILPIPTLRRSTTAELPTYGEQALQEGVTYVFSGSVGHTLVFVNANTDLPMQIYAKELPGAIFVLDS